MKRLIVLLFVLSFMNLFPQDTGENNFFTRLNFGVLGGINYASTTGVSLIVEGKTNLTSDLNLKFSLGYVESYQDDFQSVKAYKYDDFFKYYQAYSYNLNQIEYDIVPISVGFEYILVHDKFSPYCFVEGGYNYYNSRIHNSAFAYLGYYNSYNDVPTDYRNNPLVISDGNKSRLGLGVGTLLQLSGRLNMDIRYMYQFNTGLINTQQLLFGFTY